MAKPMSYKRPKNTKKTLLRLLKYLGRHKISMAAVAFLVLVSSGANILGTYLLKPVINRFIEPHDTKGLLTAVLLMALMYAAGALATLGYNKLMVRTAQKTVSEIRSDLFAHTQKLPLSYFDVHTHGELMSRFTNDVDTVTEALNNSFTLLIQSFIMTVGTVIMLVVLNFRLSLIVIGFLILMLLYILFNSKMSKKYFKRQQNALGSINGFVEEIVDGQKVEKVFNHEDEDFAEFCRRNEAYRVSATKALSYSGMMVPSIVSLSYFNYAISACVGGLFVLRGLTDIGSLASYLVYVRQSAMPMNQFTQQANFILSALSGAERIFDMMDTPCEPDGGTVSLCNVKEENGQITECTEHTRHFAWKTKDADGRTQLVPLKGDVRFHDVSFGYTPEKKILDHIDLYAKPGQKIAFVGSTGAGKTTIINLITRFYEIDGGKITYDGIDIRDIKKDDLRRSLSVVVQDTHLFTGSIKDNIRYGNQGATDEDVVHAAKIANADSFIRRLPNGYDTVISGDGDNLSQGQRQLLAIARAAASKPPVLIHDAATSAIYTRTEKLIEKSMDALMENRTVFVIAHRLSTVRNSHAILVIEKGKIIERGSHEELLAKHGRYYQLYTGACELA